MAVTSAARTARATERYLGWGRMAAGAALVASLFAGVLSGPLWFTATAAAAGVLLVAMGLATGGPALVDRARLLRLLGGSETALFAVLVAVGVDEDTGYVVALVLLMLVLAGLRGRRVFRAAAGAALGAEVTRQLLAAVLGWGVDPEESVVGLGLGAAVGLVVAEMVDLARRSEAAARDSEAAASHALAETQQAIGQLEAMHRVVASGIGEREDETLQRIVEEIAASVGLPYVSAVLVDPDGRPRVSATTEPDVRTRDDIDPLAPGPFTEGPLARALTGAATRADQHELTLHADLVAPRGDGVVHPLTRSNGAVIGALVASVPPGERIEEHAFRTLGRLAAQASLAIESARTVHREVELADRYRELDRMKTDFIAITSHELRTPLTTITGVVEMLHERDAVLDPGDRRRLLGALRRQTDRLARLVDDLRTVSLVDAGTLAVHARPTDVETTVRETVSSLAEIDTRLELSSDLPTVSVDPDRFAQVLSNLVVNGDQHGQAPVHVHAEGDPDSGVTLRVWDEGPGIPHPHRTEVFERFSRLGDTNTHSRGSGLGLFIARQLTEAMGGRIRVVDRGERSAFEVWFPVCPDEQ